MLQLSPLELFQRLVVPLKARNVCDVTQLTCILRLVQLEMFEIFSQRVPNNNLIVKNFFELRKNTIKVNI